MNDTEIEEIHPPNPLKEKVGEGGIDKSIIDNAEQAMQHNEQKFLPVIERHMENITEILKNKQSTPIPTIQNLSHCITQLKAQGSMFNYPLVTEVSRLILNFLPRVKKIDGNILEIISAYQATVRAIATQNLRGAKTSEGHTLLVALKNACERYCKHHL